MERYSFLKGWNKVPRGKSREVKQSIMKALNITSKPQWYARLNGKVEPKVSEVEAIESVFASERIKDIWGE
jgi:hypothetical protein